MAYIVKVINSNVCLRCRKLTDTYKKQQDAGIKISKGVKTELDCIGCIYNVTLLEANILPFEVFMQCQNQVIFYNNKIVDIKLDVVIKMLNLYDLSIDDKKYYTFLIHKVFAKVLTEIQGD